VPLSVHLLLSAFGGNLRAVASKKGGISVAGKEASIPEVEHQLCAAFTHGSEPHRAGAPFLFGPAFGYHS
jgi:hypothetical protein